MHRKRISIFITLILGLLLFTASCSKSHKSDRSTSPVTGSTTLTGTYPTGTNPTGTNPTGTNPTGTGGGGTGDIASLVDAINQKRSSSGAGALTYDDSLAGVAQGYADYMASIQSSNYWPDLDGNTPEGRISAAGISFVEAGEGGVGINGDPSWSTAHQWLQDLYGDVLNDPKFTHIGIGNASMQCTS